MRFLAQSVQDIDELTYAVVGGEINDAGSDTSRCLSYNAIFSHAVKATQELNEIVKLTTPTNSYTNATIL